MSGESLDLLKVFLNILPPLTNSKEQEELMQQLTEFQVVGLSNRRGTGGGGRAGPVLTEPGRVYEGWAYRPWWQDTD